jgi:leucyl aminopeptidase
MFLDKCGATTVLSAFQTVVRQRLRINLTCSIGLVENSINENAYRPSDIIASRKGLTVEIGNTDAEGRLVLADCMHWTQQHFKTTVLIELSTLTGAIVTALGRAFAGLFTNSEALAASLKAVGDAVHEHSWHMPCTQYHT